MVVILKEKTTYPEKIQGLPKNYDFEINKTLKTIERHSAKRIGLQFPDGLLCYAPPIIDTIKQYFPDTDCIILDDVVYGACCVDDESLPVDLLLHYGHSCLIPVSEMNTRVLYIFVEIRIDISHVLSLIEKNFEGEVAIIGTIQFNSAVQQLRDALASGPVVAVVPQVRPLSPGEVLGCTSPAIYAQTVLYIGDGRFHLESAMIRNPGRRFFRYCPYSRKMSEEFYDNEKMLSFRKNEIERALSGKKIGVILGTLGRQGNKRVFDNIVKRLKGYTVYKIVLEEINEWILDTIDFVDGFVQVSCPRLSIDWGVCYKRPLLSPFEVFYEGGAYLMDYYSKDGTGGWKNYTTAIKE